jgi:hypothetical protein
MTAQWWLAWLACVLRRGAAGGGVDDGTNEWPSISRQFGLRKFNALDLMLARFG